MDRISGDIPLSRFAAVRCHEGWGILGQRKTEAVWLNSPSRRAEKSGRRFYLHVILAQALLCYDPYRKSQVRSRDVSKSTR
jgi:hypothetical protein